jgi:tetratricopeptide (TPR) repeat protein
MTTIEHLWQGVSFLWNNANYVDIDKTLSTTKDFHPTSALLYITAPFSQFIETSGEAPGTTDEIIKRAERAIEIARKYDKNELKLEDLKGNLAALGLKMSHGFTTRNPDFKEDVNFTLECATVYATALMYEALAEMSIRSYVKGNTHLRTSWKVFEKLDKEGVANRPHISDRVYYSIRFGVGMILTLISSVPYKRLRTLERAGFTGDMGRGLEYLFEVVEANALEAGIAALQIQLASIIIPTGFGNPEDHLAPVLKMSDELCNSHPSSVIFALNRAAIYNKVGRYKAAILHLINFMDKTQNSRLYAELAKSYMAYANFQKASEFSEKALKAGFGTISVYFLSAASWIAVARNTEYATKLLKGVHKPSSIDVTGLHIYRRIKAINQGKGASILLLPFEYLYYFRHIEHLALYEESVVQLQTIYDMLEATCAHLADESPENQALFYTIKGAVLKSLKKENDAIVYFEKVLEMHQRLNRTEVHCALFASEEIGEISFARRDYAKAEKCFKEVIKHTDSHRHVFFSEALQRRAFIALRQLKEAESQPQVPAKMPEKHFFTLAKNEEKERQRQEKEQEKEKEKGEKKDRKKKSSLAERCALNRGTSFILTVEKKMTLQGKEN